MKGLKYERAALADSPIAISEAFDKQPDFSATTEERQRLAISRRFILPAAVAAVVAELAFHRCSR